MTRPMRSFTSEMSRDASTVIGPTGSECLLVEHTLGVAGKARTAGCSQSPLPSPPSPSLLSGSLHHGPMTRRLAYPLSIVAATALASATELRAQNFDTVQVKVSRVAGPVYLLEGA